MWQVNTIGVVDALEGLRGLPDGSIQCCVSSPPFWRQRDYGVDGQIGMESTPELYVEALSAVFDEVRRVLKKDGTLWLNLGDAYWGSGKAGHSKDYHKRHKEFGRTSKRQTHFGMPVTGKHPEYKNKDLIGLPWMVAFALRKQGWFLRQDIIWSKKNCMPESVGDRCTRSHEYIFMFSKSSKYYYDAQAIGTAPYEEPTKRIKRGASKLHKYAKGAPGQAMQGIARTRLKEKLNPAEASPFSTHGKKSNKRTVWEISIKPFKDKHFAVFPLELPTLCIKAGSRIDDIVLDPFMGAGTTALAAALLQRKYTGFELNSDYAAIARRRLRRALGLFYPSTD